MEQIKMLSKDELQKRNEQLSELISIDPKNRSIYENELVEINIRLVSHILQKYRPYTEDQVQIGCIGLINASRTFDPNRGVSFSSYAGFLIERELHAAYRIQCEQFEHQWIQNGGAFTTLDELVDAGKDSKLSVAEVIADDLAEFDFIRLLDDFQLSELFEEVIEPAMDQCIGTKNVNRKFNVDLWKRLETSLLLDLIELAPLHARLSYTQMSAILGISIPNVKKKHTRLLELIKEKIKEKHIM